VCCPITVYRSGDYAQVPGRRKHSPAPRARSAERVPLAGHEILQVRSARRSNPEDCVVTRLWLVNTRTGRKDNTSFRSLIRTNACFTFSFLYFTTTIGMCFSAQCRMRAAALLPISRAIDASGTYFILNLAIDCSEMRKPVDVCQPLSHPRSTRLRTHFFSQCISFAASDGVLA